MRYLLLSMLSLLFISTQAFSETYSDQVYNETINVDGNFTQPKLTQSQKMKKLRKRIEKQTERMVAKKIETLRLRQEILMNKKIMKAMNKSMNQLDQNL